MFVTEQIHKKEEKKTYTENTDAKEMNVHGTSLFNLP